MRKGFTLIEMLVVMGIMLVVALIALPAFRALTGQRSTEAAHNQLAGLLGRARGEAIGLQEVRGVAFFIDPDTQRVQAVQVRQTQYPSTFTLPPMTTAPEVFLDYVADRDPVLLPKGVGIQMTDDCLIDIKDPTLIDDDERLDDGYFGFNAAAMLNGVTTFTYGGVILFDGYGRVINKTYGFKCYLDSAAGRQPSGLAKAWGMTNPTADFLLPRNIRSQLAFVIFNAEEYANLAGPNGQADVKTTYLDPQITGGVTYAAKRPDTDLSELDEERWLDANGAPQLVNRNNGTLIRAE